MELGSFQFRIGNWLLGNGSEGEWPRGALPLREINTYGCVGFPPGFDDPTAKGLCSEVREDTVALVKPRWYEV